MAVNFYGSLHLILRALPGMLERRHGSIVAVTSMDAKKGLPRDAPYAASKFALTGFMDVLRQELHGTGVSASTVLPGRVDTPMIERLNVPWVSRKISADRTARAVVWAIRRGPAEVFVPYASMKLFALASAISAPLGDWLARTFRLEGEEQEP
jgi:short-subunit dehydrogenase